jgi:hypothetical protein
MKIIKLSLALTALSAGFSPAQAAEICRSIHESPAAQRSYQQSKGKIKMESAFVDRTRGVIQLTGQHLVPGQKVFPERTPADPVPFLDPVTKELYIYGTQVDGTGFSYLKYKNAGYAVRGVKPELIAKNVYLPNGQVVNGKEAIWDTYRLPFKTLEEVFSKAELMEAYRKHGLDFGSDVHFGGIALQETGALGRWTTDNWRRRVHPIGQVDGKLQIIAEPVFNPIAAGMTEKNHPEGHVGFGDLPFLPGDYIGHAYGPNFKLVKNPAGKMELWIISEEVTRRVLDHGKNVEVTEIVARKMVSPFETSALPEDREVILTVNENNDPNGKPHADSDRGKEMSYTKLIEGFRPMSLSFKGYHITKQEVIVNGKKVYVDRPREEAEKDEFFFMTGSSGNFAGDDYDARVAVRKGSAIGPYQMIKEAGSQSWKGFLKELKKKYKLSWAGRGAFLEVDGQYWLIFHAADKDIYPDGSYTGPIPPNTHEYHRNLYAVPVEFFINVRGEPDMRVLLPE